MIVDLMHLVVLIAAIGFGAWSLIAFRTRLPRGRFVIFTAASIGALFGCAAVGGEVGLLSQEAWFATVIGLLAMLAIGGYVAGRRQPRWR
jgi:4-hydroxybenzoate polyprenyltransferase